MITIKRLNKEIKARYPDLDIELVQGEGYFYFDGDDGLDKIESIYVFRLNQPSLAWWIQELTYQIDRRRT